jgi:hypothetical protein
MPPPEGLFNIRRRTNRSCLAAGSCRFGLQHEKQVTRDARMDKAANRKTHTPQDIQNSGALRAIRPPTRRPPILRLPTPGSPASDSPASDPPASDARPSGYRPPTHRLPPSVLRPPTPVLRPSALRPPALRPPSSGHPSSDSPSSALRLPSSVLDKTPIFA